MKRKSFTDKARYWFYKYLNGWKGTISIFLVIVMMPFTSIALTFEEASRYQSAMEMMNEVVDSSAFSSIADYDSYLDKRFALLATSQESDVNNEFNNYLTQNVKIMGKSVTVNSNKISGNYSLADIEVLKQQILENSEVSVTTKLISDGCDVDDLLDKLKKKLELDDVDKMVGQINDTADLTSSIVEVIKKIEETITTASSYKSAVEAYRDSYSNSDSGFVKKLTTLAEKLKTAEDSLDEDEDTSNIYNDSEVIAAITDANNAAKEYKKKTDELIEQEDKMKDAITGLIDKLQSVSDNLHTNKNNIEDGDLAAQCTTSTDEGLIAGVDQALISINSNISPSLKDDVNADITKLNEKSSNLSNFNAKQEITSSTTADTIPDKYTLITQFAIPSNIYDTLVTIKNQLDDKGNNVDTSGATNFLNLIGQIMNLSGVYDASLNSVVTSSVLYNSNVAKDISANLILDSMTMIVNAGNDFITLVKEGHGIRAVIVGLGELLVAIGEFFAAIVTWSWHTLTNVITLAASGPNEMYNSLLLYGYSVYNLPNRVSIDGRKTLFGYDYSDVFSLAGGVYTKNLTGGLGQIGSLSNNVTGSDTMFKGAEGEYVLIGSNNEIQNQAGTFMELYMLRLLLNLRPVLKDVQLSSIAALAGPMSWVVKVAAVIVEPMLDCILLVNGRKVYFWKNNIWLSYSGVNCLVQELLACSNISAGFTDMIKGAIQDTQGLAEMNGEFSMDYNENLMLLMVVSLDQTRYLERLQNVIQMEGLKKYNNNFSLDKTYTVVKAEVGYTLNPMFNLDGLTQGGLYTKKVVKYVGY